MNEFISQYGFLILLFPLAGAAINGFLGKRIAARFGERAIGYVASGSVLLSFLVSLAVFASVLRGGAETEIINRVYTWLNVGFLRVDIALLFDRLSAVMLLVITGVGFLIHVYSIGYMHGDKGFYRFFAYLNLFVFSMLVLVLGENLFMMFIGWEGVGLCSYLLIGFWYDDINNAIAGNKAFIVNRVGDLGFILGVFVLFWGLHGALTAGGAELDGAALLSFPFLRENVSLLAGMELYGVGIVTIICLLLFWGATGKSAQLPLYVWLPDAMAGPTPVSALIHAATMVTAGVYMIGRLNFLFSMSSVALGTIAAVGAFTAFFAATMGCVQNDIKKVLAYSTISQLGYMFMAMGVASYSAGIFHLMTHALFKACLFLGAGSVILGMHHEQDIRVMGGLRKFMPRTFATFLMATLAIAGVPLFSGFFSKDEILWSAWSGEYGHPALWFAGVLTAGLTAFYMTRLLILVFFGENRREAHGDDAHAHEIHESPSVITVPLIVLAVLSVVGGYVGVPEVLSGANRFSHFLEGVFGVHGAAGDHHLEEIVLMLTSVAVVAIGGGLAVVMYHLRPGLPALIAQKAKALYVLVSRLYFVDEMYDLLFVRGTKLVMRAMAAFDRYVVDMLVNLSGIFTMVFSRLVGWFDDTFVDGLVNLVSDSTLAAGGHVRKAQTGRVQVYVMVLVLAVAVGVLYKAFM